MNKSASIIEPTSKQLVQKTVYSILFTISFSHLLNDMMQSVIPSVYPLVREKFHLTFGQIGLITLTYQLTASLLQPFVGYFTDRTPRPYSLPIGMSCTLFGLILLSRAASFPMLLVAVACVGIGSSIFHPESSRIGYMASGGKRGLAQSIFQLGGNSGSALGPLLAAVIIIPYGQQNIVWFGLAAILGIFVLFQVARWYKAHLELRASKSIKNIDENNQAISQGKVVFSVFILLVLIFSKYFYLSSMTSYFTFYMIDKFHVTVQQSQLYLFIFLGAVAAGTLIGGPLGDRFGRKYVIWISILGVAPFTLLLPFANLFWTGVLAGIIGVILASAFSAILVYAQELLPGKVGMVSGLFFGFAFGMGGLGSAILGKIADHTSIAYIFHICSFLPLIGIITGFLPNIKNSK